MQPKRRKMMEKTASIVSVGSWNPRIFTPNWVSENVYSMPEGDTMNVSLNDKQMNLTYNWKGIQFFITDRGIEIKADVNSLSILKEMERIYKHLSDILSYTPVSAVGYNLNILLSKEEFEKSNIGGLLFPNDINIYTCNSQTFAANKDGAIRSFDVRRTKDGAEIKCNFHYANPQDIPSDSSIFEIAISELKHFLGYELSF